jgi:hypothetical protein
MTPDNISDHDILIELRTEVKELRSDVTEIKDTTKLTLSDHESRIRTLESKQQSFFGGLKAIHIFLILIIGLITAIGTYLLTKH